MSAMRQGRVDVGPYHERRTHHLNVLCAVAADTHKHHAFITHHSFAACSDLAVLWLSVIRE
jgi:hypothetical protein